MEYLDKIKNISLFIYIIDEYNVSCLFNVINK